jgi:hypothetical protein
MSPTGDTSGSTTATDIAQHEKPDDQNEIAFVFQEIDPEEERRLVRKLDRYIMPLMAVVYFFQCKSQPSPRQESSFCLLTSF